VVRFDAVVSARFGTVGTVVTLTVCDLSCSNLLRTES
jgi:hypothetical protein